MINYIVVDGEPSIIMPSSENFTVTVTLTFDFLASNLSSSLTQLYLYLVVNLVKFPQALVRYRANKLNYHAHTHAGQPRNIPCLIRLLIASEGKQEARLS